MTFRIFKYAPCRAYLNDTSAEAKKVLVEFGVGLLENLAVDYSGQNVYWTDTELNRIEVVRFDGNFRRVLLWKDLHVSLNFHA